MVTADNARIILGTAMQKRDRYTPILKPVAKKLPTASQTDLVNVKRKRDQVYQPFKPKAVNFHAVKVPKLRESNVDAVVSSRGNSILNVSYRSQKDAVMRNISLD